MYGVIGVAVLSISLTLLFMMQLPTAGWDMAKIFAKHSGLSEFWSPRCYEVLIRLFLKLGFLVQRGPTFCFLLWTHVYFEKNMSLRSLRAGRLMY